jgi:hypothetical protein
MGYHWLLRHGLLTVRRWCRGLLKRDDNAVGDPFDVD